MINIICSIADINLGGKSAFESRVAVFVGYKPSVELCIFMSLGATLLPKDAGRPFRVFG